MLHSTKEQTTQNMTTATTEEDLSGLTTVTITQADYVLLQKLQVFRALVDSLPQNSQLSTDGIAPELLSAHQPATEPPEVVDSTWIESMMANLTVSNGSPELPVASPAMLLAEVEGTNLPTSESDLYASAQSTNSTSGSTLLHLTNTSKGGLSTSTGSHSSVTSLGDAPTTRSGSTHSNTSSDNEAKTNENDEDEKEPVTALNQDVDVPVAGSIDLPSAVVSRPPGYSYGQFCTDLNVNDDYIIRLLDLLVRETAGGANAPHLNDDAGPVLYGPDHPRDLHFTDTAPPAADNQQQLDDYFMPSPVMQEYVDYDRSSRPPHRRMLAQAISNTYFHGLGASPSPFSPPVLESGSASSSLSNSPMVLAYPQASVPSPLDISRAVAGHARSQQVADEEEHWRRQHARRMRLQQERAESGVSVTQHFQRSSVVPSSALATTGIAAVPQVSVSPVSPLPISYTPYSPAALPAQESSWVSSTGHDGSASQMARAPVWDAYNDPSLESLSIQSINGVSLSNSWDD